jgi:hypothetical protein
LLDVAIEDRAFSTEKLQSGKGADEPDSAQQRATEVVII